MFLDVNSALFSMLRILFANESFTSEEMDFLSDENNVKELFAITQRHGISHLLAYIIMKNSLLEQSNISNTVMATVYHFERLNYETNKVCSALETAGIKFLPLKGSVIRELYPEPWMRNSCDIDILVLEADLTRAISYLVENLNYIEKEKGDHDVSLFSPNGIHIEIHYRLAEENLSKNTYKLLSNVWEDINLKKGYSYWYEMPDELFYFFHIAHMAKHFISGGCGIRTYIDLWVLDNINNANLEKRNNLLKDGELYEFAVICRKLARIWLGEEKHIDITKKMQNFILSGGVYGTRENKILVQQQKKGGKIKYITSKIFLPYDVIKEHYPILNKYYCLMPIMQIRRWFKLLFFGIAKETVDEIQYSQNISRHEASEMKCFLHEIGL